MPTCMRESAVLPPPFLTFTRCYGCRLYAACHHKINFVSQPELTLQSIYQHVLSRQEPGGVSCSPTGYRFGFGSPTRLVRLGLTGAATVSGPVGIDGALPFCEEGDFPSAPVVSTAGEARFFLRPRAGFGTASAVASDAWITLAGSCILGGASTFLRDLVFLTFGVSSSGI